MTISQQIAQSLRTDSQVAGSGEGEEDEIFDIDEHLRSSAKKVLLQTISFVDARQPYNFNLKKLKSKYVILNPSQSETLKHPSTMSPALKVSAQSISEVPPQDGIPTPKMVLFSAEKVELTWKKAMRAGAGLANLGNTCFLNSSLQCLAYTAPLVNYLIHSDHRKHCHVNGQFCMLCAMQQHLYNIHSNAGQVIKPMHILKNLRMIAKHLQFGRQEDAHEFIRYSVDAMQKSCLFGYCSKMDVHIKATTAVHQIFGGYLRSRVKCIHCKSVSDTYDPFLDLSLDINKQGCVDLQRCFEMFVHSEVLQGENAYKCMQCKCTVRACKKFSIHRAPNVLMLQLKRFSNFMGNKINKELAYPSKLNIGPYMSNRPEGGLWYELYAVLVHSGFSCQSGHYYAYAKAPNNQWYCFNDSLVHQVSVSQALNQQAYLLFYSRNPKSSTQTGSSKNPVDKGTHGFQANYKMHTHNSGRPNGVKPNGINEQKVHPRPVIGPQLPPDFKKGKTFSYQSTSSSSDIGTPFAKQQTSTKVIGSNLSLKPSGSTNSNRKPLQFTINRNPKPTQSPTSKLSNSAPDSQSATKPQSTTLKNGCGEEKISSASSAGSLRSPVLDKLYKDSSVPCTSSSSTSTSYSSLSSSTSTSGPSALKALVSYSSDDDSDDDYDTPLQSNYGSLSSTLHKLRNQSTAGPKKVAVKDTVTPPIAEPTKNTTTAHEADVKKSGVDCSHRKDNTSSHSGKREPEETVTPEVNGKSPFTPEKKVKKCASPERKGPSKESILMKKVTPTQREPILHLLNNEINSASDCEQKRESKKSLKSESASGLQRNNVDVGEKVHNKKLGALGIKVNGFCDTKKLKELPEREKEHKSHSRDEDSRKRDSCKVSQERKRHHSTDSTSSASSVSRKKKDGRSERVGSPSERGSRKPDTPTKKRKREERGRHSDEYDSDHSCKNREKHRESKKSNSASPRKRKKHERKHFYPTLKRSHSKSNGKYTDDSDRDSSVEKLYRDKEEYEQSLRRKAKKEKKRRMKERQILQSSINAESPKSDRTPSLTNGVKEKANEDQSHKSYSQITGEKSTYEPSKHRDRDSKKENGKIYKNEEERNGKLLKSTTNERPNILAQLLKQSSGKAYGAKVNTWNGEESLVEKDAHRTWVEQKAPLIDDWDREYDKGRMKKIKKKDHHHKGGPVHNLFQKFQNMRNQRNGV